jgi:tRNA (uracil-5-)-methyltransferase TRM9
MNQMKRSTIIRLNALNQRFYQENAASFADSRQAPWSGWEQLKPFLDEFSSKNPAKPLHVLDVGCGEGRFGRWLSQQGYQVEYRGLDNSEALLSEARKHVPLNNGSTFQFEYRDVVAELLDETLSFSQQFDVIVLFGVLHHIPSAELRKRLLERLSQALTPNGLLIFTLWQLQHHPQLLSRQESAEIIGLSPAELEVGDYILDWRRDGRGYRYCHDFSGEPDKQFEVSGLKTIGSYFADGNDSKSNKYIILSTI